MKYIISWVIVQITMGSCPDKPKENRFGVTPTTFTSCAVMHINQEDIQKVKEFETKKEAYLFLNDLTVYAKNQNDAQMKGLLGNNMIKEIKIDSIKSK